MRRLLVPLLLAILSGQAFGAGLVSKVPRGYVFDQPRILTQQRLFGLAHAVGLLSAACAQQSAHRETNRKAHAAWHTRQAPTIESARADLARYYFGAQAAEAGWDDIVRALGLSPQLRQKPGSPRLRAACATFAESLDRRDNDLAGQYRLQAQLARIGAAEETVAEAAACAALVGDAAGASLHEALAQWHAYNGARVAAARQAIEQRWREAGLDGSVEQWLDQARRTGRARATPAKCPQLSVWLLSPAAQPGREFDD